MNAMTKIELAQQALIDAEKVAREADPVRKARAALELAQREVKEQEEAERQAKYKAANEAEARKRLVHITVLVKGLNDAGFKSATVIASGPRVDSGVSGLDINLEAEMHSNSSWRSSPTGRMICVISAPYNSDARNRRFPQKADGSFSFDKIVKHLNDLKENAAARAMNEADKKSKARSAGEIAKTLCSEYGLSEHGPIKAVYGTYQPSGRGRSEYRESVPAEGKVFVCVGTLQCTPDVARQVLDLLVKLGVVKTKEAS